MKASLILLEYVRLVVVVVSCYARGSVQIYVLCDKKMNTKEQHTSPFSQGRYYKRPQRGHRYVDYTL